MEEHSNVTKEKHNNIKDIPKTLEILQFMFLDLNNFFNRIVDEEQHENALACHHEVIKASYITDQFQSSESEAGNTSTGCWVLK
jgi:hypothetical protein